MHILSNYEIDLLSVSQERIGRSAKRLCKQAQRYNALREELSRLVLELRERPWHLSPGEVADKIEGVMRDG